MKKGLVRQEYDPQPQGIDGFFAKIFILERNETNLLALENRSTTYLA